MTEEWDEARLQQYIDDGIEEGLNLDYKDSRSLSKSDGKKREITKDVSAMANSDGGIIIYGIGEYQEKEKQHLPEKITPIDRREFSKEWLEHIINNIRPKIDRLRVHPIDLSSGTNDVAYVVDIPASNTAHQAMDKRYYERFNFESVSMEDYKVRMVMNRGQHPKIDLEFDFLIETTSFYLQHRQEEDTFTKSYLRIIVYNHGSIYVNYVNAYFEVPKWILDIPDNSYTKHLDDDEYYTQDLRNEFITIYAENTQRSIIYSDSRRDSGLPIIPHHANPPRHEPLLPDRWHIWLIEVRADIQDIDLAELKLSWEIFADNSGEKTGQISLSEVDFTQEEQEY